MKFNAYLAIIAMAALCASCVKEPVAGDGVGQTSGEDRDYAHYSDDVAVRGWVRIKLDEQSQPLKVGAFTSNATIRYSGFSSSSILNIIFKKP